MNNRPQTQINNPAPYSVRGEGRYKRIYVPSAIKQGVQQYAWIELVDPPEDELRDLLYDPSFIADWKISYLQRAYEEFRDAENERKRGYALSYNNLSVELPAQDGLYTTVALTEEQIDDRLMLASLLAELNPQQRHYLTQYYLGGYSFVEIARLENPEADEAEIKKRANSIGRSVKRSLTKLQEISQTDCPVPTPPTGG